MCFCSGQATIWGWYNITRAPLDVAYVRGQPPSTGATAVVDVRFVVGGTFGVACGCPGKPRTETTDEETMPRNVTLRISERALCMMHLIPIYWPHSHSTMQNRHKNHRCTISIPLGHEVSPRERCLIVVCVFPRPIGNLQFLATNLTVRD